MAEELRRGYQSGEATLLRVLALLSFLSSPAASGVETSNLLSELFADHAAVMLFIDPDSGTIVDANRTASRFYGLSPEALRARTIQDLNLLEPDEVALERERAAAEHRNYFIFPHRVAGGEVRTVEVHSSPVRLEDGRTLLFSVIHDVTGKNVARDDLASYQRRLESLVKQRTDALAERERRFRALLWGALLLQAGAIITLLFAIRRRKRAEHRLRQEQARLSESRTLYQSLVDSLPFNVYRIDRDGRVTFANRSLLNALGVSESELLGKTAYDVYPDELARKYRADDERVMQQGEALHVLEVNVAPGGERQLVEVIKLPLFDAFGRAIGIQGVFWDVTERRRAQEQLEAMNRDFVTILENTTDFVYFKDEQSRFRFCSQTLARITGHADWRDMVGKHDREVFPPELAAIYEEEERSVFREGRPLLDKVDPYYDEAGNRRFVTTNKWPVFDESGERVVGVFGISRDITELKRAEAALKANEEMLRTLIDAMPDIVCFKDGEGRWLLANEFDLELFGLEGVDYRGKKDSELARYSDFYRNAFLNCEATDEQAWQAGRASRVDEVVPLPDGEPKVFDVIKLPTFNDDGSRKGLVVVGRDITERKAAEQRLDRLAHYDSLTQLPNRTLLADRMRTAVAHARRSEKLLAVCYLDLDGFKPVNDSHGHKVGDQLLMQVGERLQGAVRGEDTVGRLGGDEFVLLLGDIATAAECSAMLARILEELARPFRLGRLTLTLSASIGVTLFPRDDADSDTLLRHADQAMYWAKEAGRNRYHFFDPAEDRRTRALREANVRIREGLADGEFVLHYQPKVDMRAGTVIGMEALIRWQHPERGLLPPSEFLPLLADAETAVELDLWVLDRALAQLAVWRKQGLAIGVSVNVSAVALQLEDFPERVAELLGRYAQVPAERLELEVLETSALDDLEWVAKVVRKCRRYGVDFALDDFGTGYSSLSYLRHLPAGVLKIDRSFVQDMLDDPGDLAIVEGVVGLSEAFQRSVIAEGVETEEHGTLLMELGCDLGQGYGIARPMPAEDVAPWLLGYEQPQLWREARDRRWSRDDLPLLTMGVEHKRWIARLLRRAQAPADSTAVAEERELAVTECRFGRWLAADGRRCYGMLAEFRDLERTHREVHRVGLELLESARAGRTGETTALGSELLALRDRLLGQLYGLRRAGAPDAG